MSEPAQAPQPASESPGTPNPNDPLARILLALVGVALIAVTLVSLHGWSLAVGGLPVIVLGVLLIVLSAFYRHIDGSLHFGTIDVPIGSPRSTPRTPPDSDWESGDDQAERQRVAPPWWMRTLRLIVRLFSPFRRVL